MNRCNGATHLNSDNDKREWERKVQIKISRPIYYANCVKFLICSVQVDTFFPLFHLRWSPNDFCRFHNCSIRKLLGKKLSWRCLWWCVFVCRVVSFYIFARCTLLYMLDVPTLLITYARECVRVIRGSIACAHNDLQCVRYCVICFSPFASSNIQLLCFALLNDFLFLSLFQRLSLFRSLFFRYGYSCSIDCFIVIRWMCFILIHMFHSFTHAR